MTPTKRIYRAGLSVAALAALAALAASPALRHAVAATPEPAASAAALPAAPAKVQTIAGMMPVIDARNLYSEIGPQNISPLIRDDLQRVYVPNLRSNDVSVIDPETLKVIETIKVGRSPQHVVPAYDLRTLWVANNAEGRTDGSLTPIDPRTGKAGAPVPVDDPYNMYFTPDGKSAIVVAEARHRLDFRDPKTMAMQYAIDAPKCGGINHADFSIDGKYAIFTCEFDGTVAKIDLVEHKVAGYLKLNMPRTRYKDTPVARSAVPAGPAASEICSAGKGMPQDIRVSPDGKRFYVADMEADGVHILDGDALKEIGFISTGVATHGLYPSRDGTKLYISNRGSHKIHGPRNGPGSITVLDFATEKIVANWVVPGGGSPDMGNVSADGKWLWLSGRFDDVVYRIDTGNGKIDTIKVGREPHGLTVWPQPGRYSMGHTGNLR